MQPMYDKQRWAEEEVSPPFYHLLHVIVLRKLQTGFREEKRDWPAPDSTRLTLVTLSVRTKGLHNPVAQSLPVSSTLPTNGF
jgi:hypothetical protein